MFFCAFFVFFFFGSVPEKRFIPLFRPGLTFTCACAAPLPLSEEVGGQLATMGKSLGTKFSGKGPGLQKKTRLQRKYLTDPKAQVKKGSMAELDFGEKWLGLGRRVSASAGARWGGRTARVH